MQSQEQSPLATPAPLANTSGQGSAAVVPPEISGWNWGAFVFNWIWGIVNETYLALLVFVPFVGFAVPFVLGFKGNEWAWRNKRWDSVEHFKRVQRKWAIGSLVAMGAFVLLIAGVVGIALMAMKSSGAYVEAVTQLEANKEAMDALGAPVSTGTPSGSVSESGSKGKADLSFSAKGSKAKGTVYVDATRDMGKWQFNKIELQVDGQAERIDLAP